MSTLGRNIAFPIYNGDGTSFHDLVIKKSTSDSIVMSLGDKVTGDVYYKDNTLVCDMDEYIMVDGVKYSIVNPPTIVREGLKSDNGDLKGMTKYSFEFYHPMYMLGNMAFSDVAVTNAESMFKSHDRTFSWIGNLTDYVAKLNKNLQDTQFIVSISSSIDADSRKVLSDVLSFTNNTIADALKTAYDTWHFPFVVDVIKSGEQYYNQGKRFLIQFGNPTREILDSNNQPFVFHFGKGVGLKNNSRTPRNNKIVTRVAGYGSEQNIPYGYPQIPWTGDPSATQTADGYPIYEGIVGGVVTKLVKHPFTRTHLMPSVYAESVRKKVDSAAADYDNTTPLVDYYDAPSTYPNPINLAAPKLDIVGIETIKPELGDMAILGVTPLNNDLTPASGWDDTMDDDGNYLQSYFKITLPQLDFDIYACASITEEMKINMRSGACIGCTFDAQVDWDDYKKNFFDAQGNFLPNGEQRDLTKYPKSSDGSIDLIVKKDLNTYGTLMPNVYQKPTQGDKFVILGISMPSTYITNAEERLDAALMTHMLDNNVYYYDYPLKFDEDFFYNHTDILSQVRPNSVLRFAFGGVEKSLYIKQITIKYGDGVLPKYDITLTDNIEVVLNQIGLVADDVSRLAMAMMQMNKRTNINITNTESLQKYVDYTIMPNLESIQKQLDGSQVTYFGNENPFDASQPYSDGKYVVDPTKFPASEWDDDYSEHDGDMFYNRETGKGYEFTIIDNSTSPVVYGWQLIQDEDIIQALTNAQNAQDTADGKRRVFICDASHHTPNPPYDVGDLWVNVKYPYSTGATYDDEILKCVVAKTEGQSFSINDWSLANGYTAALRNFINGSYADDLEDIQNQIDGKAETWYQSTDPSTAWTTTALKNQHKGDIWHNSSTSTINGVKAGQDAIWNGTAWVVDETVPQAVYDEIDGKCAIYVSWGAWGNDLQEKDLFIPAANTTQDGITYKANKVYRCVDKDTPTFQEIAYTDDTQYNGFITKLIGSSGQTKDAAENAIAAIKHALADGNTYNEGGLILSNLISLGTGSPTSGTFTPWAGISGIYKTSETGTGYKGHGIAAWFGGGMIDKEVSAVSNAAKSLFRFDGSGYVADGNLSWDKNGNVTIQGYSINATTLQVGGANVATQAMLDNFVSKAFFNRLFTAYDANGNAIVPNDTTTAINNLKLMVGTWTEQYLSALGLNSEGGGGGTGSVNSIKVATNTYLDPDADGIIDMSNYVSTATDRANWNTAYSQRHTHSNKSVLDGITSAKVTSWDNVAKIMEDDADAIINKWDEVIDFLDGIPDQSSLAEILAAKANTSTTVTNVAYSSKKLQKTINGTTTDIVTASTLFSDGLPTNTTKNYVLAAPSNAAGTPTFRALVGADLPDLSATYATASRATTLEGYFTNGVAKTADKLNTGTTTYTAWGQTYWSSGVPQSISGNMTSVGSITPSANGNALGTTSARFNIYGTSGNFSGNVSITGTLGVTGATTLTGLLTANGGIVVPSTKTIKIGDCTISWDSTNSMLKFDTGIYSTGAVSALGSNSSGGGSGTFDEEAMWTALGTTSTAKVIASSHIPNLDASKITSGTFAAARIPDLSSKYLPLTGGTLQKSSGDTPLYIKTTNTSGAYIGYKLNDDTTMGFIGVHATYGATYIKSGAVYPILRSDNFGGYAYALYGGTDLAPTSTNTINLNDLKSTGSYYVSTNTPSQYVTNKPDDTQNYAFRVWVSAPGGTSGYRRQRFQYLAQMEIYERFYSTDTSAWGNWYKVQDILTDYALASELSKYVPMYPSDNYDLNELGTYGGMYRYGDAPTNAFPSAAYGNTLVVGVGSDTCFQLGAPYSSSNLYFRTGTWYSNGTGTLRTNSWRQVAFTDSNVASATKLQTAKTIWGQSFDGSDNVSGQMSNVGNIYPVESVKYNIGSDSLAYKYVYTTWVGSPTNNILQFGANNQNHITVTTSGNVGIGTTSPAYKLDVNGDVRADNFRGALIGNATTATKATQDGSGNTITSTYLPLAGGTLTGQLTISTSADRKLVINNTDTETKYSLISFRQNGTEYGTLGTRGTDNLTWNNYTILHSNNTYVSSGKGYINGTEITTITGNAATATTLQTSRTIWGQSFDGTANVSGTLTDTGSILPLKSVTHDIGSNALAYRYVYATWVGSPTNKSLQFGANNQTHITVTTDGNVGIGTTSPSSKLHVAGNTYVTGTITVGSSISAGGGLVANYIELKYSTPYIDFHFNNSTADYTSRIIESASGTLTVSTNLVASGEVTASSDERKKDIIRSTQFNIRDIASARSVIYKWNDDRDNGCKKKIHGGSIAQDWIGKADSFLSQDGEGWYSINYGALALCSAITIAREVVKHDDEITRLKKEVVKLRERVAELEERRIA